MVHKNKIRRLEAHPADIRPVDLFPLIDWRSVNKRKEVLNSGEKDGPFWPFAMLKKIWKV